MLVLFWWAFRPQCPEHRQEIMVCWIHFCLWIALSSCLCWNWNWIFLTVCSVSVKLNLLRLRPWKLVCAQISPLPDILKLLQPMVVWNCGAFFSAEITRKKQKGHWSTNSKNVFSTTEMGRKVVITNSVLELKVRVSYNVFSTTEMGRKVVITNSVLELKVRVSSFHAMCISFKE